MTVERALRALAGSMVLVSVALAHWIHPAFLLLTAFVGANLLQSAFTGWCPAMTILRRLGLPDGEPRTAASSAGPAARVR